MMQNATALLNLIAGQPLLLFVLLAALSWPFRSMLATDSKTATARADVGARILALAFLALLLSFAYVYLRSAGYIDHIEPNTAIVSYLFNEGLPVYHDIDYPARYSFLYGPVPYIASGLVYGVAGASIVSSKIAGLLALAGTLVFSSLALARVQAPTRLALFVGLAYLCGYLLLFRHYSFWSKPDSFMTAFAALGVLSCMLRGKILAPLVCGIALAGIAGAKIHGLAYFLPILAWQFRAWGFTGLVLIAATTVTLMLLPFLVFDNISLANYFAWLQNAGAHGLSPGIFLQNLSFLLFALLPLVIMAFSLRDHPQFSRARLRGEWLLITASITGLLLVLIAASKPGSGPHHFMPFLPLFAVGMAALTAVALYYDAGRTRWIPIACVVVPLVVKLFGTLSFGFGYSLRYTTPDRIVDDLQQIRLDHPGYAIQMGYGDGSSYPQSFPRVVLVFAGEPYLLDAAAMMDFDLGGVPIPKSTRDSIAAKKPMIWLIPKGQEPFSIRNWYGHNREREHLFDESFRTGFQDRYTQRSQSEYFDLWIRNGFEP